MNTKDETKTLADAVKSMAQNLKKLLQSEKEKIKLESQLEMAGVVQRILIPEPSLHVSGYDLESLYQPADECGGDWWSYVETKEHLMVLVGDVTGHGYGSALLVAASRAFVSMLQLEADRNDKMIWNASQVLSIFNPVICDVVKSQLNMTVLCVIMNKATGEFEVASAGHPPACVLDPKTQTLKSIQLRGERLGENKVLDQPFAMENGKLEEGQKLILFTDGFYELGGDAKLLNRKGFLQFLKTHTQMNGKELVDATVKDLMSLNTGMPLADDVTMVVVERAYEKQV